LAERKSNSPWGSNYKEGLPSTAVNDTIEVNQILRPTVNTGVIDVDSGQWEGVRTSDKEFSLSPISTGIPNGAAVLRPSTADADFIDMTGYSNLFIALKPSNGGNFAITAVMGPDTRYFANLQPVASARALRGGGFAAMSGDDMDNVLLDAAEDCQTDLWNIFIINQRVKEQKNLQFQITNNTGDATDLEFGYMRLV
jgi:hypothetical protein